MKKLTKIVALVLIATLILGSVYYQQAEAKSIYFAGKYKNGSKVLVLNQYSSPEDLEVGNCLLKKKGKKKKYQETIFKIGKNKYLADILFSGHAHASAVTFKVYKNKVKVSGSEGYDGTYKLVKRYARP